MTLDNAWIGILVSSCTVLHVDDESIDIYFFVFLSMCGNKG